MRHHKNKKTCSIFHFCETGYFQKNYNPHKEEHATSVVPMELPGTHALEKEYDQAVAFETHRKNVNDAKMRAVHQVRLALCWVC